MVMPTKTSISALFARYTFLGILAALLALAAPGKANAKARKIELGDLQKIVGVSSPAISPDGKSIVIIVSRVNFDEDRYDSQLVLVDIATGAQRVLTNVRPGLNLPQWSPSGDRLAFLAEAGDEKTAAEQIFVLPVNGGAPKQITSAPLGVEQFAWRPNGAFFAFASPDEPPNREEIEKHHDLFEVGDNDFLATAAPTPSHILLRGLPIDLLADYGQGGSNPNVRFATLPGAKDHCAGARKPRVAHRICSSVTSFVIFSGPRITVTITFSPSE
jgi:hypothetical protein